MVDPDATFPQEFFPVAIAPRVAEIPPHRAENDVSLNVAPFEQGGIAHGRSPVTGGQHCSMARCTRSPVILATEPREVRQDKCGELGLNWWQVFTSIEAVCR